MAGRAGWTGRRHRGVDPAGDLAGSVALVTGAARGIGAATSRALAERGVRLVLVDLDAAPLHDLVDVLNARHGEEVALAVTADVCDLGALEEAVRRATTRFGRLDLVLANAGIASYGSVRAVDPATFKRVLDVNVLGVFHTVRAALPALVERGGYVLVVSSLAAFAPAPGLAAYNASKAGVEHFANALRLEVAHEGVAVGVAHMSWVETPLVEDARRDLGGFEEMLGRLPGPLGRTTDVAACAEAFVAAMASRRRRVYVPGWVRLVAHARGLASSSLAQRATARGVPGTLPRTDAHVAALGRWTSARNTALDDVAVRP